MVSMMELFTSPISIFLGRDFRRLYLKDLS